MSAFYYKNLFKDAFGYAPPEHTQINIPAKPARIEQSSLGQPYYNKDIFGREFFLPITIDGAIIPFAVLSMVWKKTIVETPMPERGGSVNELISIDDYSFNVKGILIDEEGNFPEKPIIDFHKLFLQNNSVVMRSVISDIVLKGKVEDDAKDPEGHRVIIKSINWIAVSGVEHAKPFEMELKSDMIFDLEIA